MVWAVVFGVRAYSVAQFPTLMLQLFDPRITSELPCPAEGDMGRGGDENIGKTAPDTEMGGGFPAVCKAPHLFTLLSSGTWREGHFWRHHRLICF